MSDSHLGIAYGVMELVASMNADAWQSKSALCSWGCAQGLWPAAESGSGWNHRILERLASYFDVLCVWPSRQNVQRNSHLLSQCDKVQIGPITEKSCIPAKFQMWSIIQIPPRDDRQTCSCKPHLTCLRYATPWSKSALPIQRSLSEGRGCF